MLRSMKEPAADENACARTVISREIDACKRLKGTVSRSHAKALNHGVDVVFKQDGKLVPFPDPGKELRSRKRLKITNAHLVLPGFSRKAEGYQKRIREKPCGLVNRLVKAIYGDLLLHIPPLPEAFP